jgi:hypothetical protein
MDHFQYRHPSFLLYEPVQGGPLKSGLCLTLPTTSLRKGYELSHGPAHVEGLSFEVAKASKESTSVIVGLL